MYLLDWKKVREGFKQNGKVSEEGGKARLVLLFLCMMGLQKKEKNIIYIILFSLSSLKEG